MCPILPLPGNRELPLLPVALSLSASFTSATTILGIPAEVYTRGGEQWLWALGMFVCFPVVAFCILPIIYRLELTNAYEVRIKMSAMSVWDKKKKLI